MNNQTEMNFPPHFPTKSHSYHSIENKSTKQSKVLSAIVHLGKASDADIAEYLGWPINRIIPRRSELGEFGLIKPAGVKMGVFGKPVKTYSLNK